MTDPIPLPAELLTETPPIGDDDWAGLIATDSFTDVDDESRRWQITDEKTAAWAMAKLAEYDAQIEEVRVQVAEWRDRLDGYERDRTAEPMRRASFLEGRLARWALDRRAANPKGPATFPLPSGKIRTQVRKATVDIASAPSAIAWLKANRPKLAAQIVKTVEKILITDVRKYVEVSDSLVGFEVGLSCGHVVDIDGPAEVGQEVRCDHDDHDEKIMRTIEEILSERAEMAATIHGKPVPGLIVAPEHVIASVDIAR
jgi:hypothetical protein